MKMDKLKDVLKRVISALFWIIAWGLLAYAVGYEVILPSPVNVAKTLGLLLATPEFYISCLFSLIRILSGLVLGIIVGALAAFLTTKSKVLDVIVSPLLSVIRATPVATFILLVVLWAGRDATPAFIAFLMIMPVIWNSVVTGVESIPQNVEELSIIYKYTTFEKLKYVTFPGVLPSLSSGIKTSIGLAWKSGIAAEVICNPKASIGGEMYASKIYLNTETLFAWTVVIIIVSVLFEKLVAYLSGKILRKYNFNTVK